MNNPITSTNALRSTIETDALIFRWFLYLIVQEKIKNELMERDNKNKIYNQIKAAVTYQRLCSIILLVLLLFVMVTKLYIFLLAAAVILWLYFKIQKINRAHVANLSLAIILKNFEPSELGKNTLYQIGEYFSRKYGVKSIVLSMTSVDFITRKTALYALVFSSLIFPLESLLPWVLVVSVYWVTCIIINTAFVYKHL